MKKIVLMLALLVATLTVSAENILYFTYSQASRTVPFLNNQNELMIYCGYADELPTYVLVNEVWAEQISSSFYEIWLYGFDAYTGEEVYMPIDLGCIWLMNRGNIYSAAQALRFRSTHARPTFVWAMPPYNPFVRYVRPTTYYYTYHYDVHRPGWRYDLYPTMHYHPYYLRRPAMPAPMPPRPYTPGREYPGYHVNNNGTYTYTSQPLLGNITACRSQVTVQNNPTNRSGNTITSNRGNNTITTTDRSTGRSTTTTAPTRNSGNSRVVSDNDNSRNSGNSRVVSDDNSRNSGNSRVVSDDNSRNSGNSRVVSSDNNNSGNSRVVSGDNSRNSGNSRVVSGDNSRTPSSNRSDVSSTSSNRNSGVSTSSSDNNSTSTKRSSTSTKRSSDTKSSTTSTSNKRSSASTSRSGGSDNSGSRLESSSDNSSRSATSRTSSTTSRSGSTRQ